MRTLAAIAVAALLGAFATTGLFFSGFTGAGAGALVLACLALTSGFTAVTGPLGNWGVPGDER